MMRKYLQGTALILSTLAFGCGDDTTATCVPGMSVACPCPSSVGAQACNPDGTFGACVCFELDAGRDAGRDAGSDAGRDAPIAMDGSTTDRFMSLDVAMDTAGDSGTDAGPVLPLRGECADDGECFFVMDTLSAPSPDPGDGTVVGANLDGEVTMAGDPGGCGKPDFTHPNGTMGVDNALAGLLPIVEMGGSSIDDQFAEQIAGGSLLITVKLSGVDGVNDPDVLGTLYPTGDVTGGAPILSGGTLAPGQTIDRTSAGIALNGTIVNGRFEAALSALPIGLPFGEGVVFLSVGQAVFSADITANGLENGEISGSISILELAIAIEAAGILELTQQEAESLLSSFGDLEPNPDGTICARLSVSFAFNAIPAIEGSEI